MIFPGAGRATTPEKKRDVMDRILRAWEQTNDLRLGQFLFNATLCYTKHADVFVIEDVTLATVCETYVRDNSK